MCQKTKDLVILKHPLSVGDDGDGDDGGGGGGGGGRGSCTYFARVSAVVESAEPGAVAVVAEDVAAGAANVVLPIAVAAGAVAAAAAAVLAVWCWRRCKKQAAAAKGRGGRLSWSSDGNCAAGGAPTFV